MLTLNMKLLRDYSYTYIYCKCLFNNPLVNSMSALLYLAHMEWCYNIVDPIIR